MLAVINGVLYFWALSNKPTNKFGQLTLKFHSNYQKKYFLYFVPTLICFILATDHGRNISLISIHLVAFYSILSLDLKKFDLLRIKINKIFFIKVTLLIFVFFYIFMWKLDQMAGFGLRGIVGKIEAIRYARENDIPFFGICLGMQLAVIEIAKKLLKIKNANSSEFVESSNPLVGLMTEWKKNNIKITRNKFSDKGGTMRLGAYPCDLKKGSLVYNIYKKSRIFERHRHRYEVNSHYMKKFENKNFIFSGMSPDKLLPEILESKNHDWFIGVQFHPELKSRPQHPHPLFVSFIKAAIKNKNEKN